MKEVNETLLIQIHNIKRKNVENTQIKYLRNKSLQL